MCDQPLQRRLRRRQIERRSPLPRPLSANSSFFSNRLYLFKTCSVIIQIAWFSNAFLGVLSRIPEIQPPVSVESHAVRSLDPPVLPPRAGARPGRNRRRFFDTVTGLRHGRSHSQPSKSRPGRKVPSI